MNSIHLEKIDENNFLQAFGLKLGEGQDKFVSHPIRSLAQAYVYRDQCTPFGIFCGETMVGYVMVIYDYDLEEYDVWHLMIDKEHQGRGYAKEAMRLCLEYIAGKPFGDSHKVVMRARRRTSRRCTCTAGSASARPETQTRTKLNWR